MNKEIMSSKDELLNVMKKYGIKEYYTFNGYELGGNPRGGLIIETSDEDFKEEFFEYLFKGFDEEEDIGWVLLIYRVKIRESSKVRYIKHMVE